MLVFKSATTHVTDVNLTCVMCVQIVRCLCGRTGCRLLRNRWSSTELVTSRPIWGYSADTTLW